MTRPSITLVTSVTDTLLLQNYKMSTAVSRRWVFTLNNYTDDDEADISSWEATYTTYGREVGDSGTPHLQGFVVFAQTKRLAGVKRIHGRCHWEVAQGTSQQARDYCQKDDDYVEFGTFPGSQGKRNDLERAVATLKEHGLKRVAEDHTATFVKFSRGFRDAALHLQGSYEHETVRGYWIYGPPGTGKTHSVYRSFPGLYIKAQNKWWDGYSDEEVVLLDDLDTATLGHLIKIWSDRWSCTGETKGGTIHLRHHMFIITSNYLPEYFWPDNLSMCEAITRRFKFIAKNNMDDAVNFT